MSQSRRQFLKIMAAAPLIVPFGLTASPLMRYLKPTMSPLGFFDPSDQPTSAKEISFQLSDFPEAWTCIPFTYPLKITEFNPEQQEIREIPAFIVRLEGNQIAAYSRICTRHGCILNYVPNPSKFNCGCAPIAKDCCCSYQLNNPAMICPVDLSTFDLARDGRVVRGPAPRPPRKFELGKHGNKITVVSLEGGVIR